MRFFVLLQLPTYIAQLARYALLQRQPQPTLFTSVKPLAAPAQKVYVVTLRLARDGAWTSAYGISRRGREGPCQIERRSAANASS